MRSLLKTNFVPALAFAAAISLANQVHAQLIVGQDGAGTTGGEEESVYFLDLSQSPAISTALFRPQDFGLLGGPDGMAVDIANRIIYFCEGSGSTRSALYSAHFDDLQFNFSGQLRVRKIADIRNNSLNGSLQLFNALAWDPVNSRLIGSDCFHSTTGLGEEGFWVIDVNTGVATPLFLLDATQRTNYDFRGLDYNPVDGLFYAVDEATAGSFSGLCSIDLNGTNAIVNIAAYPPGITDIDGIAVGNDRAYYIKGDPGDVGVRNIGTATNEANIVWNSWATGRDNSSGGWAPDALTQPAGSNLAASISSINDTAVDVAVGNAIDYTVQFTNFGPSVATNVTYTITLGGAGTGTINGIVSTSGLAVESPTGTITATLASVPVNSLETVTFSVITTGPGALSVTASIPPGGNTDVYLGNNSESISHSVRVFPPIELVFTTVQSSPASDVPNGGGLKFKFDSNSSTQKFRRPLVAPHTDVVGLWSNLETGGTLDDDVFMLKDPNGDWSIAAREGVTGVSSCELLNSMILNSVISVNDFGQFAIANDTSAVSSSDETVIVYDGSQFVVVARENTPIPALGPGVLYGTTLDSPAIDNLGRAAFRVASIGTASLPAAQNSLLLADDGSRILAWKGVTVPTGQAGGGVQPWEAFDADTLYLDCIGANWLVLGDLTGATTSDDILAVNNQVVLQQGQGVIGLTGTLPEQSTTAGVISAFMLGNGEWYARGTTSVTDQDFVIKGSGTSYTVIAKHSAEIYPGAGETWSDADGWSPTFFAVAANSRGDYVITGRTNNTDLSRNLVFVLNGTTELFRENDPVDLDQNNIFDDDAFVSNLDSGLVDSTSLSDSGEFLASINLRNGAGAFIGKALVKFSIDPTPQASNADLHVSTTVSKNLLDSVGQQVTYTILACNYGPLDAHNVTVTDPLPAGLDFVSATGGATETPLGSNTVIATIPVLPSCDCREYTITAEAVAEGVYINTASIVGSETDPNNANNMASTSVTIENRADVAVTMIDNGGAPVGQNFVYTITVKNNGPATATNVQIIANLDPSTTFVSATNGAVEGPTDVVTRTFASLAPNATEVVQITVVGTVESLVTSSVSVSAVEVDLNAGNNSASVDSPVADIADLAVTLSNTGLQVTGDNVEYYLVIYNDGPATANNVDVTVALPMGLNFVSATNGAVENPLGSGNVEASFASIPSQGSQVIVITASSPTAGTYLVSAAVSSSDTDPDLLNNSTSLSTRFGEFRQIRPIYTRIASHPSSIVPGLVDYNNNPALGRFDSMLNINVSEDGNVWTIDASSDLSDTNIDSVMMLGSGFTGTVLAQEGKSAYGVNPCFTFEFFDDDVGFNSSNDFAWGASTLGTGPDIVYTNIGGVNSVVAKAGDIIFGLVDPNGAGDETVGNSDVSQHLLDNGNVRWIAGVPTNIHSSYRPVLVEWNGSNINAFMQSSVTIVSGEVLRSFPIGRGFYTTPDGASYLVRSTVGPDTLTDVDVLVYGNANSNAIVLRNGDVIPDSAIVVDAIFDAQLASNGDWIARGDDPADNDWVVSNGVLMAATGQPINGGAEVWGNAIGIARINAMGDYLIGGNTSEPNTNFDNVLVLNGTDVIVREGDPVDLDGNGQFDDNVFINTFNANHAYLSNDRRVHFLATLRNAEGTNLQTAFLVVEVAQGCGTIQGDADASGIRNGVDVSAFVDCILGGGTPTGGCACVDYDADQDVDFDDLAAFATQLVTDP